MEFRFWEIEHGGAMPKRLHSPGIRLLNENAIGEILLIRS
jgi:hypothetical protein